MSWIPSDEIKSVLDAVRAAPLEKNLNVDGVEEFGTNILKYDSITMHSQSGIQFNDESAPFYIIAAKRLQIRDSEGELIIGLANNDTNISGRAGRTGKHGSPSHNPADHTGAATGGHATDGASGGNGRTLHRANIYLLFGAIEGLNGEFNANEIRRLPIIVSARGVTGGHGGIGGNGGNGGNGRGGRHGVSSVFDCKSGPQSGGPGGNAGRGGRGGIGGNGGNGAKTYLVGPGQLAEFCSWWLIDTRGGFPGEGGEGGSPGIGGTGGNGGGPRGHCHGNGARGARGNVQNPTTFGKGNDATKYGSRGQILMVDFPVDDLF